MTPNFNAAVQPSDGWRDRGFFLNLMFSFTAGTLHRKHLLYLSFSLIGLIGNNSSYLMKSDVFVRGRLTSASGKSIRWVFILFCFFSVTHHQLWMKTFPTSSAEHGPEDSRTRDGDDLADFGRLPACYAVPGSSASGHCRKKKTKMWLHEHIFTQKHQIKSHRNKLMCWSRNLEETTSSWSTVDFWTQPF